MTSLYFYDTETSGISPKFSRIMQFAGQRVNEKLEAVGKPDNMTIKLSPDVLPDADAILVHGITPQRTLEEGITEADFAKYFIENIATPGTTIVGFNSIRFDDEFVRYLLYRNFYDPYQWHWQDNRSRWDLLDALRMMRALRPDGIEWPFASDGKPTVRLEYMTRVNNLPHGNAHDALGDVEALLALARLVISKQPKLFSYLMNLRSKHEVARLVDTNAPFVYSSGKYPNEFLKTTVVTKVCNHPKTGALVYDLRFDPDNFAKLTPSEIAKLWRQRYDEGPGLPVKSLLYNRCPAIAPLGVLDNASAERLKITSQEIQENYKKLSKLTDFGGKLIQALQILDKKQASLINEDLDPDSRLYEGFWSRSDEDQMAEVRKAKPESLLDVHLSNERLKSLLPLYKARNFSSFLTPEEAIDWEKHRFNKLLKGDQDSRFSQWAKRLAEVAGKPGLKPNDEFLLTELQLYAESIMPEAG